MSHTFDDLNCLSRSFFSRIASSSWFSGCPKLVLIISKCSWLATSNALKSLSNRLITLQNSTLLRFFTREIIQPVLAPTGSGAWIAVSVEPWLYRLREDLHNEHLLDMDTREIFQLAFWSSGHGFLPVQKLTNIFRLFSEHSGTADSS